MNELLSWEQNDSELRLFGGIRLHGLKAHAPESVSFQKVDYSYMGTLGELGVQVEFNDLLLLKLAGATGFRPPNLQESTVVGDTGNFYEIPNGNLKPENISGLELGVSVGGSYGKTGLTGHAAQVTDTIDRVAAQHEGAGEVDGQEVRQRDNVGNSSIVGIEWYGESGEWKGLGLFGDLAWVRIQVERNDEVVPGRREPPLNARSGFFFKRAGNHFRMYSEFALKQGRLHPDDHKDFRICEDPNSPGELLQNCDGTEGWATLNLRFTSPLNRYWDLRVGADNVLDSAYRRHGSGMDAMGTSVWGTLVGRF